MPEFIYRHFMYLKVHTRFMTLDRRQFDVSEICQLDVSDGRRGDVRFWYKVKVCMSDRHFKTMSVSDNEMMVCWIYIIPNNHLPRSHTGSDKPDIAHLLGRTYIYFSFHLRGSEQVNGYKALGLRLGGQYWITGERLHRSISKLIWIGNFSKL